jgi:hypothetical protein
LPKVLIEEADAATLRTFAKVYLGLEIDGTETKNVMKSKLKMGGYEQDFVVSEEPQATRVEGADRPSSFRVTRLPNGEEQTQVCIMVEASNAIGGDRPVPVAVNGLTMLIPRGKPVWVPEPYEHALRNAVEDHYDQTDSGLGTPHQSRSYPYSVALPTPQTGAMA